MALKATVKGIALCRSYSRRQNVRSEREIPYRRASAAPCRCTRRFFSTIRSLSPSDECRRRPPSSATQISIGKTTAAHAIRQYLKSNCSTLAGGRLRRLTGSGRVAVANPRRAEDRASALRNCGDEVDVDRLGRARQAQERAGLTTGETGHSLQASGPWAEI